MIKQIKALISDDTCEVFGECSRELGERGIELVPVSKDGLRVVEEIGMSRPQVALVDVFMPGLDCMGVMKALDKLDENVRPAVLAISGFGSPRIERELAELGVKGYVVKPFNYDKLAEMIYMAVESGESVEQNGMHTESVDGHDHQL